MTSGATKEAIAVGTGTSGLTTARVAERRLGRGDRRGSNFQILNGIVGSDGDAWKGV